MTDLKAVQRTVNLAVLDLLVSQGWAIERDNEEGGALVLVKDGAYVVGGFHAYEDKAAPQESIVKTENLVSANPNPTEPVGYVLERDDETEWWNGEAWVDTLNDGAKVYDDDGTGHMPTPDVEDARWVPVYAHEVDGCLTTEACSGKDTCQDCLDVRKSVGEGESPAIEFEQPERSLTWVRAGYPEGTEEHEHHHGGAVHRHVGGDQRHGHRHVRQDETTLLDTFYLLDEVDPRSEKIQGIGQRIVENNKGLMDRLGDTEPEVTLDLQGFDKEPGDLLHPGPHATPDENDEHFADTDANHVEQPEPKPVPKRRGPRKKS